MGLIADRRLETFLIRKNVLVVNCSKNTAASASGGEGWEVSVEGGG